MRSLDMRSTLANGNGRHVPALAGVMSGWCRGSPGVVQHDLAEHVAGLQLREGVADLAEPELRVDDRPDLVLGAQVHELSELVDGSHRRADYLQLQPEDPAQVHPRQMPAGSAGNHDATATGRGLHRVFEGG